MNSSNSNKEDMDKEFITVPSSMQPVDQANVIAEKLSKGNFGLDCQSSSFILHPLKESIPEISQRFLTWLEHPGISDENILKIFASEWMQKANKEKLSEKYLWVFAYSVFRKDYAMRFIEALKENQSFAEWHGVVYPSQEPSKKSLEEILLQVLKKWPTQGRSGYELLNQLQEVPQVRLLKKNKAVQQALDEVEGRCDFGSLEKIQARLQE